MRRLGGGNWFLAISLVLALAACADDPTEPKLKRQTSETLDPSSCAARGGTWDGGTCKGVIYGG